MDKTYPVTHSDVEWRRILTPEQYDVMRGHGTERPGSCSLLAEKRPGTFSCAACDQPLFEGKRNYVAVGPRALPQGACTSPAISNQIAKKLDRRLAGMSTTTCLTSLR